MKKIPTIFNRNPKDRNEILPEENPECAWVFNGEGKATRKYDGTCCKIENGILWKRYDRKAWSSGKKNKGAKQQFKKIINENPNFVWDKKYFKEAPEGWVACMPEPDIHTGHWPGWLPVSSSSNDQYFREAFNGTELDGTYELCGPKIQGNPENFDYHVLVRHADATVYNDCPRDFKGLKNWFKSQDIEGVVFHHPDGRMAKIKKRDFGLER